jgi:hypothetical protein
MLYTIFIFIIIIIILHYGWNYVKDTFTVKKKKYVNHEIEKYRQLLEEYSHTSDTPLSLLPSVEDEIQNDLELFLQNNIEQTYVTI